MSQAHKKREVVITGMGVVSPIGTGNDRYCESLKAGRSGIDYITLFDASRFSTTFAGEAEGFEPEKILSGFEILDITRERRILMASTAAKLAVDDAGLTIGDFQQTRCGIVLSSGVHAVIPDVTALTDAGIYSSMFNDPHPEPEKFRKIIEKEATGENRVFPVFNRVNAGAAAIASHYKIKGICYNIISACAAATQAIGNAYHHIQRGEADMMLTGGYDSMVYHFGVYAFGMLELMSRQNQDPSVAMKPFDKNRDGFALGEGAGVLILEEKEHARKRGAKIYVTLAGYGASIDAYKVTDPHPEGKGAMLSMQRALADAGIRPDQVDYINAHGTATLKNDRIETDAIKKVFGKDAYRIPVSSTKSMIGHLMSAGGVLELIATVLGMEHDFIPPTINYKEPDPLCDLDYVPNISRETAFETAISNSFGLGGQNATLVVRKNR